MGERTAWLKSLAPAEWYDRYSRRFEDTRLPRTAWDREVLAQTIGADGFYLLDAIYSQTSPTELRQLGFYRILHGKFPSSSVKLTM